MCALVVCLMLCSGRGVSYVSAIWFVMSGCSNVVEGGVVYVETCAGLCSGQRLQNGDENLVG